MGLANVLFEPRTQPRAAHLSVACRIFDEKMQSSKTCPVNAADYIHTGIPTSRPGCRIAIRDKTEGRGKEETNQEEEKTAA